MSPLLLPLTPRFIALTLAIGLISGFIILQYADVRASYAPDVAGRALAIFTMAMFLGVALVQWLTGMVAGFVIERGHEPLFAVHATLARWVCGIDSPQSFPDPTSTTCSVESSSPPWDRPYATKAPSLEG